MWVCGFVCILIGVPLRLGKHRITFFGWLPVHCVPGTDQVKVHWRLAALPQPYGPLVSLSVITFCLMVSVFVCLRLCLWTQASRLCLCEVRESCTSSHGELYSPTYMQPTPTLMCVHSPLKCFFSNTKSYVQSQKETSSVYTLLSNSPLLHCWFVVILFLMYLNFII